MQARDIASLQSSRQRRYVAVLYADLCGSTELASSMEAELYADVLDALKGIYREIIPKHGGTLLQVHGDGHLAMFGYPGAGEEDVRLALNAALEMHQAVRDVRLNVPDLPADLNLRLHSGVHAGLVLVQEGDVYGGSYQLRGDVTNICARLSDAAGNDEILVCGESLRGSEPFFECGGERVLQIKGLTESMVAYPVLGVTELSTRYQARRRRSRLPFVGRDAERTALQQQWQSVQESKPRLVYIAGSPGVGKTRLADEFLNSIEIEGRIVMRASCESITTAQPLEPFVNVIRSAKTQSPQLYTALQTGADLAADVERYVQNPSTLKALADAFVEFVRARCNIAPLVMFIDDWQWADEASRSLIAQLAMLEDLPLMLVLATRAVERTESGMLPATTTLQLDGLVGEELESAIESLLPQADPFVQEKIRTLSGGNPLFLEELCQASTLDVLDYAPSPVEHVPQWLYSLVQARVLQLNERERNVVQVAAVIGDSAPLWLLQRVAEFDDVELLTGLTVLDLLFPNGQPGEWHFKHGLTRAIVYDLVGLRERQRLHRTIAQTLVEADVDEDQYLQALAFHFTGAGMRDEAISYAQKAGERAMTIPALDVARVQYRLAIDLLDDGDITLPVYEQMLAVAKRLSFVAIFDPSNDELPVFLRLLELAVARDDVKSQANANYWLGRVYYGLGRPRQALHYYYQARTLAQECGFEKLIIETNTTLGQATAANCEHSAAVGLLERALRANGPVEPGSRQAAGTAYALGCLGMVLGDQGNFEASLARFAEAQTLIDGTNNPTEANILAKLAAVKIWQHDWDGASATAERVARISEKIKNHYLFGMSRMLSAYVQWQQTGAAEHVASMRETTNWLESFGLGQFLSLNYGWLTEVSAALGDVAGARHYAAGTIWRARVGDGYGLATAARTLSELAMQESWQRAPEYYLAIAERSARQRSSQREQALNEACAARLAASRATTR